MHGYIIFYGDDLNRNGNLKEWKLIIHGYTILNGGDLNEDETLKKRNLCILSELSLGSNN